MYRHHSLERKTERRDCWCFNGVMIIKRSVTYNVKWFANLVRPEIMQIKRSRHLHWLIMWLPRPNIAMWLLENVVLHVLPLDHPGIAVSWLLQSSQLHQKCWLPSDLFSYSLYSLSQQIHQLVLRQGRVRPLPAASCEGVTEWLLAADGVILLLSVHVALQHHVTQARRGHSLTLCTGEALHRRREQRRMARPERTHPSSVLILQWQITTMYMQCTTISI